MSDQMPMSVAARLERLPFSAFHRRFLIMVTAGEFVEMLMLLGNGVLLVLLASTLHFSSDVSTYAVPDSFFFGEFVGAVASGYVADRFGRRRVFFYDLLIFSGGVIAAGFASSPYLIGLFIFVGGLGVGGEFPAVDTYATEMMSAQRRGRSIAAIYTVAVLAGPLIAGMAYVLSHPHPSADSWRVLLWAMGAVGLMVWVIRLRVPESPRWLEAQGRREEAESMMAAIEEEVMRDEGLTTLPTPPVAGAAEPTGRVTYGAIFAKDVRRTTIMMLVFQFFQSGIFYGFTALAPTFLVEKHISLVKSLLFTMIIYAGFFAGSVVNLFIIDKVERKWGIVVSAVLAGVFGTLFAVVAATPAVVVFGFLVTFCLWQFSNFLHTYQAEIFPTRIRSTAAGTVYGVSRISTALLTLVIVNWVLPHGLIPTFGLIWVFIAVVVVDIALFGPQASGMMLEHIGASVEQAGEPATQPTVADLVR